MLNIFVQLLPILGIGIGFSTLYSIVLWISIRLDARDNAREKQGCKKETSGQNSSESEKKLMA
jgi:subtilase family serine protease